MGSPRSESGRCFESFYKGAHGRLVGTCGVASNPLKLTVSGGPGRFGYYRQQSPVGVLLAFLIIGLPESASAFSLPYPAARCFAMQ